ncbi:MAG: helix-turn-helix domain-containing protein [Actinomycetota bacterium]|nr:helix-turn-helix domain-containing protein [Actinomycetota bacterium]
MADITTTGPAAELPEPWTVNTIYGLTRSHRIRFVRVGKELRFRPDDLAAWLESEVVEVTGPEPPSQRVRRGRRRARDLR